MALSPKILDAVEEILPSFPDLPADLILAIILTESDGNRFAIRFEPGWSYAKDVKFYADLLGSSLKTESTGQSTSWGLMQVMGTVAREHGFRGWFPELCDEKIGIAYGCRHLAAKRKKYIATLDVISAYNAGMPSKNKDGTFKNAQYVSKVTRLMEELRGGVI